MPPLTERIVAALYGLREARADGDLLREDTYAGHLDRLLDQHIVLRKAADKLRPLAEVDPVLDKHLTVTPRIRLIGMAP